ncbi:uncharacterized protein LOC126745038 [Anthonomus grandis grandis]|uniref:uncharacterized protein LOC126745038 n=1 Tax=Anthonomus grandis grandis TaxID=2921223 RepID=UPI002165FB3F|nr:uncharacterized protein LOC126745038 [Anthonomus grandis grandis]
MHQDSDSFAGAFDSTTGNLLNDNSSFNIQYFSSGSLTSRDSTQYVGEPQLIGIIGDEDTCAGFILAGIGEAVEDKPPNFFIVNPKTDAFKLELVFLDMIERPDIGLVLVTREAAEKLAPVINQHKGIEPTVMVIPGHNGPFVFDLPLAVKYIEQQKQFQVRKTSGSPSVKSDTISQASVSRKVSTHSIRSARSCKSVKTQNLSFSSMDDF